MEATLSVTREQIETAMPHWAPVVEEGMTRNDNPVLGVIYEIDHRLCDTSETILLGYALADVKEVTTVDALLGTLTYWDTAYEALLQAGDDNESEIIDLINSGEADEALKLALSA